jgi:segregation and condensation protein A
MDFGNTYIIKQASFEGPFPLLLSLIEERKLFINDISLASITDDYIRYVNTHDIDPRIISSFILVASTLILIKSKSLLPDLSLTEEEKQDIVNLEDRLRLYELYTKLSLNIKNDFGKNIMHLPLERKNYEVIFLPDNQITEESMMTIAYDLLGKIPKKTILPEVEVKKVISLEEMIDNLKDRIEKSMSFSFKEFAGKVATKEERVNTIVTFLAMLELVREGILNVIQDNHFEDILIHKNENQNLSTIEQE